MMVSSNENAGSGFIHSTPVPQLYKTAAKIVKEASETKTSVKQIVYEKKLRHSIVKSVLALADSTIRKKDDLDYIIRKSEILEKEPRFNPYLCRVLITELLWGKKRLPEGCKPINTILAYKQTLNAHFSDLSSEADEDKLKVLKPKYVRVNTLKTKVEDIINLFRDEGWTFLRHFEDNNYETFLSKVSSLEPNEFMLDIHVKELLIFPPKTELFNCPCYKDGRIMIQDKASCLPAVLLNPEPGSTVLDMCAAPGMKTTQMAAMMNNKGIIYAVDHDFKRFQSLNKMVENAGATCIKTINKDVISLTTRDFDSVEYVLVDPSCSGSGMVNRSDYLASKETKTDLERLEKLSGFQIKILKAALHRYPKAKRIVYSTCSIYTQENEEVVKEVLASSLRYTLVPADKYLAAPWHNFGSPKYGDIGKYCLYSKPESDHTNGFFVAVLERLEKGEANPFAVVDLERRQKGVDDDVKIVGVTQLKGSKKSKTKKGKSNNEQNGNAKNCESRGKEDNSENGTKESNSNTERTITDKKVSKIKKTKLKTNNHHANENEENSANVEITTKTNGKKRNAEDSEIKIKKKKRKSKGSDWDVSYISSNEYQ